MASSFGLGKQRMEKPAKKGPGGPAGKASGKAGRKAGGPTLREPEADEIVSPSLPCSFLRQLFEE